MRGNFIDVQERNREFPNTFDAPAKWELDGIKRGDFVKIGVELGHSVHSVHTGGRVSGERFWVLVTKVDGHSITGVIQNELELFDQHDLVEGDEISFEQRHVLVVK